MIMMKGYDDDHDDRVEAMMMVMIPVGEKVERVGGAAAATQAISRQEKQRRA